MFDEYGPLVSTDEFHTLSRELSPGVQFRITNVPTIVRRGGDLPDAREYYTFATMRQLQSLRELGRIRMARGETDIEIDFGDDASLGRASLVVRWRNEREDRRKRYERLHPANQAAAEGQDVPG